MKKIIALIFTVCFITVTGFAQSGSDAIVGVWLNKDKDAHVQIFKNKNEYFGKIIWLKNPKKENGQDKLDDKNPEASLRSRQINGLEILKGFKYDADDTVWEDGTIYDPKSGKTYSCKMTLKDKNNLNVRGFIGVSLIGRTDIWTRVK
ncbi:DUF2147 domain-containing protein [Solitalea sp. MAHUQ-68]|uniref:DUF2147 domain-containing protein n=1 Tax=Solitalea agri TaxID=2953739 RepID=A0A9X2JCZ1_9SPHI|nr:DUF2147 domain-containing protein [Solitalea agri]MCO4292315.1 DUF2147 domain-containing protein [Solitalea agri]